MSDKLDRITDLIKIDDKVSFSFEITPNMINPVDQIDFDCEFEPLFYSITWHASGYQCLDLDIAPIKLAKQLKRNKKNILLHLSCSLLKKSYVDDILLMLRKEGICNLLIILGEKFETSSSDFKDTKDLIIYIRQKTGNYFCIGVVAFPDREDKLMHLKKKIDSGADFIITQAIFEAGVFINFKNKCQALNITVPILPGIFPFENFNELTGFINLCKVNVSPTLVEEFKNKCGLDIVSKQICNLSRKHNIKHFHFFTLDKIKRSIHLIKLLDL